LESEIKRISKGKLKDMLNLDVPARWNDSGDNSGVYFTFEDLIIYKTMITFLKQLPQFHIRHPVAVVSQPHSCGQVSTQNTWHRFR
jgi:hypothetical protein